MLFFIAVASLEADSLEVGLFCVLVLVLLVFKDFFLCLLEGLQLALTLALKFMCSMALSFFSSVGLLGFKSFLFGVFFSLHRNSYFLLFFSISLLINIFFEH